MRLRYVGVKTSVLTSTFIAMRERLRHVAAGIVGDDTAEDVLHDAFCRLWKANPQVTDELQASRLSYKVVRNAAIDEWRRTDRSTELREEYVAAETSEPSAAEIYDSVVAIARRALTGRQFEIFAMHDIDGSTYDEIASKLRLRPENVRVILSRSRKIIREIYRNNETY